MALQSVKAKIHKYNSSLLEHMVSRKYKLMCEDVYKFYRGTCHLFYEELSKHKKLPFSPLVWICGDLHMENFGSFRGDNRLVYFDLNDFDEALLAPASWEIVRFLTSLFIAFESMDIEEAKAINMAKLFLKSYASTLAAGKPVYLEPQTSKGIVCSFLTEAAEKKNKKLLSKRTEKVKGKRQLKASAKHLRLDKRLKEELRAHMNDWIMNHTNNLYNYEVMDVVFRVAGLGSMGLKRYLFLLKSTNVKEKYLLVDMKQAKASALEPHLKIRQPGWNCQATRIIEIQKRMQNVPPALLSTVMFKGDAYVIQEMQSAKDGIKLNLIKDRYRDIYQVVADMGMLAASAQLRSSGRQKSASADELILFGQNEAWQHDLLDYAFNHTQKVKRDFLEFRADSA
jgi:uncharacterized protein (DUF2252 family)